jgi:pimeloyl-ACP methyl ester carboxylesterase
MNRKVSESDFDSRRQFVETDFGQIAYVESGEGAAAVFLHGFPLNGYHWRGQLDALQDIRRCLAIDLMGLGYSELSADQDLSFPAQAQMVLQVMDRLAIRRFDLIGNDSGGAIAQIIAARAPDRVTSLIVTNCDVHDNWPPPTFSQTVGLAKAGRLGSALVELDQNIGLAQSDFGLGVGFEHREALTPEAVHMYVKPLLDNPLRQSQVDSFVNAMNCVAGVNYFFRW